MMKDYFNDYCKGLESLDDLNRFLSSDLSPILTRTYFHINELKRKVDDRLGDAGAYSVIQKFLKCSIYEMVKQHLLSIDGLKQFNFITDSDNIDLRGWNKILAVFPKFLTISNIFKFEQVLTFKMDSNFLKIRGNVCGKNNIENYRKLSYEIQRYFLSKEALLTFKLDRDSKQNGSFSLELILDISHDSEKFYCIDMSETKGLILGLSNIFENYKSSFEKVNKIGKHICLVIDRDLGLKHFSKIPEAYLNGGNGAEILYFPFLFRPLSFIIPERGILYTSREIQLMNDSGRDCAGIKRQDVTRNNGKRFQSLDFFEIANS